MKSSLRKLDILLRTWCPAEKQNELREAINNILREKDAELRLLRMESEGITEEDIYETRQNGAGLGD